MYTEYTLLPNIGLRILQSDDRKYIKIIYNLMLWDIETKPNIKNWASLRRNILSNLGFLHVWLSQRVGDIKQFLVVLKQRLIILSYSNGNHVLMTQAGRFFIIPFQISVFSLISI